MKKEKLLKLIDLIIDTDSKNLSDVSIMALCDLKMEIRLLENVK